MNVFKFKINKKWIKYVIISIFMIVLFVYLYGVIYYNHHFFKGTTVNGLDISKLKVDEVQDQLEDYKIEIVQKNSDNSLFTEKISAKDIGLKISNKNELQNIIDNQNNLLWFLKSNNEYSELNIIELDDNKMNTKIMDLKGFDKEFIVEPVDAHISQYSKKQGYKIIKEQVGNKLSEKKAKNAIRNSVLSMEKEVNLVEEKCYLKPSVISTDNSLNEVLNQLNKYTSTKIKYKFGDKSESLNGETISTWLSVENNEIIFNNDKILEYISSLRSKYDTIFTTRNFETSYGQTVIINSGDYGWWINSEKEAEELVNLVKSGQNEERTPVYLQTAASHNGNDYGNTYVEINLTAQHLFFYKDGQLVLESDFVSGNTSNGNGTPSGIYSVTYTENDAMLVGEDYETPVSYWMPFNGNIGMHDATWRDQFGSNFYSTSGSHGCINMPYLAAQELFNNLKQGMPVICYELGGTESKSITIQSSQEKAQAIIDSINKIGTVNKSSYKKIERARKLYDQVGSDVKSCVSNYYLLLNAEQEYKQLS